jgi:hypothetical protein
VSIDSDIPISDEMASGDGDVLGAGTAPGDAGTDTDAATNDELQD